MLRFRRFYSAGSHIPIDVAYGLGALSVDMRLVAGIGILAFTLGLQASPMEWSNQAKEEFLRTAVVAKASAAGKGITGSWRVSLEGSGMMHAASFQSVDERAFVKDLGNGVKELHFVDSYRYNIAAYRLANLLGLDDLVPVSVERKWRGKLGAMTWWVDDVMMDEADMHERELEAPDPAAWVRQTYRVRVFNELIYDTDRNQSNMLITKDWNIWVIDCSRAFRRWKSIRRPEWLVRCDRNLFRAISDLSRVELDAELSDILDHHELDGLWARHGLIVEHFRTLIDERGEDAVLY